MIVRSNSFKYLGSVLQSNGEIDGDACSRIRAGWMKWKEASGVLCDRKIPMKLKGKFYKTAIRPAMMHGTECWPVKKKEEQRMHVAEMRMLRWMSGVTKKDKIRNEYIRESLGVAPIDAKMREHRLRWFGHVQRRDDNHPIRRIAEVQIPGRSRRGRPKKTWEETIRQDMLVKGINIDMTQERIVWIFHDKYITLLKPYEGRKDEDGYKEKLLKFGEDSKKLFDIETCSSEIATVLETERFQYRNEIF
ncbi:uncharacterized protein LOC126893156 [Diabrotica virgifera virgifera]|uniref:Uncharacterized protein n=1 Tax=Diabrotica virgifera virgifera TaxID=50390 RepID=A0ABM5L9F2_DIAVI|nr:uncharacterized protein LOC126893156 [Diabrotica virgifera virgifera]